MVLRTLKIFQKTFLLVMRVILMMALLSAFYGAFVPFSVELRRTLATSYGFNRVSTIVTMTFLVVEYFMIRLYGGFAVGRKRTKEIILSMALAAGITDVITYVQLCVMEKQYMPLWILAVAYGIQCALLAGICKLSNHMYFKMNPPKELLVIFGEEERLEAILEKLKSYQNRFRVQKIIHYEEEAVHRSIRNASAVLLIDLPADAKEWIVEYCYKRARDVYFTPSLGDILIHSSTRDLIDDLSVFSHEKKDLTMEERAIKRAFDLVVSLALVLLTSPVMLLEAALIKLEDGGPVFYRQQRVTQGGRLFDVLKFRTMVENAEDSQGAVLASKNDSRVTRVGALLRKTRLDELPQLLNILKGDMSVVGPRPERPEILKDYKKDLPEFGYRLRFKAGLTGLAQIRGRYNTTPRDKLNLDLQYMENYSLRQDIKIVFQTIVVCLTPEKTEGIEGQRKKKDNFTRHGKNR